jgi:diguanylate cyclase (GGDEF)-like protein
MAPNRNPALISAVLDAAPQGFSVWSLEQVLIAANRSYYELYGYTEEMIAPGASLSHVADVAVRMGNQPAPASEVLSAFQQRFDEARRTGQPVPGEKAIKGRVIATTHLFIPQVGWSVMHEDITDRTEQKWQTELHMRSHLTQSRRLAAAVDSIAHGLSMYDSDWRLVTCNQRYLELYELPAEFGLPGTSLRAIAEERRRRGTVNIHHVDDFAEHVIEISDGQRRTDIHPLANGRIVKVTGSPVEGGGYVAVHEDITESSARFQALADSHSEIKRQKMLFEAAIGNMSQGLCMFDRDSRLVVCNERYTQIYGLPEHLTRPGTELLDIVKHGATNGMQPVVKELEREVKQVAGLGEGRKEVKLEDGRTISVNLRPLADGGWVATHEDVTEQRRVEAQIRHMAVHDALTDLPNRTFLQGAMAGFSRQIKRGRLMSVMCLDLDFFKAVNDTLGHAVGDQVLVTVADRLRECTREEDVVARIGGDEFALIVTSARDVRDASQLAERIVNTVALPMDVLGHQVSLGATVGIAMAPGDGIDIETLLKNADMALYRAKSEGRGSFHFFEQSMDEALQRRRMLEQGLKVALVRNQFRLMYQPLIDLSTNRICCFEALIRWDNPEQGMIPPSDFIPVAEETGLISAIGEWVLREACSVAAKWPDEIRIAVNLSPAQFRHRGLVEQVIRALQLGGLSPERLELEVTESLLLSDTEATLETLHRLRALGVRISMDDFGTGYSSLSYLRSFPFDKIKIDRSFISGLDEGPGGEAIIRAVVGLGQSLGMSTTAEGVETEAQLKAVRVQGCNEVQGFLFSPPLPPSGVAALLGAEGFEGSGDKRLAS